MYKMTVLSKIKPHSVAVDQLGVIKIDQAFRGMQCHGRLK